MYDGAVVSAAEVQAYGFQAVVRHFFGDVHCDLTAYGDLFSFVFFEDVVYGDAVEGGGFFYYAV